MLMHLRYAGYVQGMNDLLSPILYLMDDESDAFWCFVGFMETMVSISFGVVIVLLLHDKPFPFCAAPQLR